MKKIKISLIIIIMFLFIININKVKAVEELPDDGGRISSSQVIQTKTGTGPFDANDEPGNDSSEDNNIVRSFDQVTWTIENTMALNGNEADSYSGGRIYFEAILPDVFTSETAKWDLDSMAWIENAQVSSDGLTLTGYYQMGTENITVPGKQTLVFVAKILGAKNGIEFQPEIKLWLNGNDEENYKAVNIEKITVSAAPNYNIKLVRNPYCASRATVNIDGEDITGRIYGYAVVYQLYNKATEKGLKGIEYPTGDIILDLEMSFRKRTSQGGEYTDITNEITPILWNYQISGSGTGGLIPGRGMFTGTSRYTYRGNNTFPAGKANSDRNSSVYDSGNININQENNILKITLNNYKFDGNFPTHNLEYNNNTSISYTENIGCFGSIYLQILVPDWDEYIEDTDYYLDIKDVNFYATSISGKETTIQQNIDDDNTSVQYTKLVPGTYNSFVYIYNRNNNNVGGNMATYWDAGDSRVFKNQQLYIRSEFKQGENNDYEDYPRTINNLLKFDANCYQPVSLSNGKKFYTDQTYMNFKMWYITKKDGTNWSSQEEMNRTIVSQCDLYENLSDIPEDKLCVGVYYESQDGELPVRNIFVYLPVIIKETSNIGQTYGITQKVQYYNYGLDRNIYTAIKENVEWPNDYVYYPSKNYVKTEYDENGVQITGTHSGGSSYGNTIQVIGANQRIQISTIDEEENVKTNYDFGKNEYKVKYKVTSILNSSASDTISGVNVRNTITLPLGLTYVPNSSNYGEPEISKNSDGTTTLVFNIPNCTVNQSIDSLIFEASIDEESVNGTQYNVIATIYASPDKVGTENESDRTAETSIQVINLSSHRLYKSVETPVIEKNGEIHYTVSYKNNTDEIIRDFQLLDILPYNGDSRGTEYTGEYTLDRLVVTQKDGAGETISNDNLEILYTNDESARNGVTSKDENLGVGWNSVNSETIKQKATAYVVKGEIGAQGSVTVDIYLKTNGNKGLDKYVNSATAQVYKETEEMVTSNVVSQVVERKIEGIAWEDSNRNGVKDEGEQVLSNVEINLTDELGQQVTDVNGNKVTSIKTDENGYYKFENLPKGEYYVQVKIPNEKYELTEKQVGTNNEINSKFNEEEKETDKIEGLNSIDLPELTVSYVNAGFVKIEGSIEITKIDAKDNSKLIEGATFKVEKLDEEGNVDNTYNIEELTTGEEGKVLFEGLEVGKYRVTETKAPSGYELLEKSIEVEITGENRDIKLTAENELKLILPLTGDTNNTIGLIIIGAIIIGISVILLIKYEGKVLIQKV